MTDILNALTLISNFVLIPGLAYNAQLALGALGVTLIYAVLRFSNFGHGDLMAMGLNRMIRDRKVGLLLGVFLSGGASTTLAEAQKPDPATVIFECWNRTPGLTEFRFQEYLGDSFWVTLPKGLTLEDGRYRFFDPVSQQFEEEAFYRKGDFFSFSAPTRTLLVQADGSGEVVLRMRDRRSIGNWAIICEKGGAF